MAAPITMAIAAGTGPAGAIAIGVAATGVIDATGAAEAGAIAGGVVVGATVAIGAADTLALAASI